MVKAYKLYIKFLTNIAISAFFVIITLSITDYFNSAMAFINNDNTKRILICLSFICIFISLTNLINRYPIKLKSVFMVATIVYICFCVYILYLSYLGFFYPELAIFTKTYVKLLVFSFSILSIAFSVLTIRLQRKFL